MTINKNNYKEIFYALQDELNALDLDTPDWIMTDFMYYIFENIDESMADSTLFDVYEKVKQKIFLNEIREQKINDVLNG